MLKLFLPVIFPSWRFFSSIGPSPRIEVGYVADEQSAPVEWLPFRPPPKSISLSLGLQQLFHNALWNEYLYLNTCAEHLFENFSEFREREIGQRLVLAVLNKQVVVDSECQFLLFRIRSLESEAGQVRDEVVFTSKRFALAGAGHKR